jgi:hypothetical protein
MKLSKTKGRRGKGLSREDNLWAVHPDEEMVDSFLVRNMKVDSRKPKPSAAASDSPEENTNQSSRGGGR